MAFESNQVNISLPAAADLSTHQYKFVKLNSAGRIAAMAAATDIPIGVLQNKPNALDDVGTVCVIGVTKIQGDADLARGAQIGTSADGQADAKIAGTDTTEYVVGQVLEDNSAAGGLATCFINCAAPHRAS